MKGTFFNKPIEYNIVTKGESWHQGDVIEGTLRIKNHDAREMSLGKLSVVLASGSFKKVRSLEAGAFDVIEAIPLESNADLTSMSDREYEWKFMTKNDCPISDKQGTMYLLYGTGDDLLRYGQLELNVNMQKPIEQFVKIFVDFFRFNLKQVKYKKGFVELKMVPPTAKEFATMDHMLCQVKIEDSLMKLKYAFSMKVIGTKIGDSGVKKIVKEFSHELTARQYQDFGGSPNYDGIKKEIEGVLEEVRPKVIF